MRGTTQQRTFFRTLEQRRDRLLGHTAEQSAERENQQCLCLQRRISYLSPSHSYEPTPQHIFFNVHVSIDAVHVTVPLQSPTPHRSCSADKSSDRSSIALRKVHSAFLKSLTATRSLVLCTRLTSPAVLFIEYGLKRKMPCLGRSA